jgi:phospholipid transport system substrate-binding protein
VRTYSSSLSQYRDQKIQVKPLQMSPSDEDVIVRTAILQENGPQIPIDYRMEKTKDQGWKVYDVVIDGASLVTTYRGSFNDQIQRGGIDALVKTLQERNRSPQPAKAAAK